MQEKSVVSSHSPIKHSNEPAGLKPRHQRQISDVQITTVSATPEVMFTGRSCLSVCRRCCERCRQTMRSHKIWMGFTASTWGFLSSVERAVILPTLWLYLKSYWSVEDAHKYYGVTMAAFSLSILVMTPVYGYAAHAGVRVKTLLLAANFLEIVGNTIYLFASSPMAVLVGRLISGIGASCEPPLYADIARATNRDERTTYIIVLLLTRQIGLIFGPSFTLMMNKIDYHVANFTLSVYNGPGLLMATLWFLHSIIILMSYPNVDKSGRIVTPEGQGRWCGCFSWRNWLEKHENAITEEVKPMLDDDDNSPNPLTPHVRSLSNGSLRPYRAYNILTLYTVTFATYFCFMSLEAALPPVANRIFGWSEVETSYVYLAASVLIIFVVIVLRVLNRYFSDRVLLLSGLAIMLVSYVWLTLVIFFLTESSSMRVTVPLMLTGIAIHVIGLPFAFAYSESLYTKLVPISDMDRAQSIFRTVLNVAFLIGPYVGGSLFTVPTVVFAIMSVLSSIPLLMVALRFDDFIVSERIANNGIDIENAKHI